MEEILQFLPYGISIVTAGVSYALGKRKSKAETENLEIEAETREFDLEERRIASYKKQLIEMQKEIEDLSNQVRELKDLIRNLTLNQCLGDKCETKQAYDKIMLQRLARRNRAAQKKKNKEQ